LCIYIMEENNAFVNSNYYDLTEIHKS